MINKEDIRGVAQLRINEIGGYLVDVKVSRNNDITIFFDILDGVTLDHCLDVSKYIEERFDRDIEDYQLTVCSAGLDSPFLVPQQYQKNIGKEVKVLLKNGKREKGKIISYEEDLILEIFKKQKGTRNKYLKERILINKNDIKETKLKINFK
tara:strand:- start:690 stop:1145 length:456 start_codon:yes stop_codon:yes gene_type:complete